MVWVIARLKVVEHIEKLMTWHSLHRVPVRRNYPRGYQDYQLFRIRRQRFVGILLDWIMLGVDSKSCGQSRH